MSTKSKMILGVEVGVRYCMAHDGVANEDEDICDFEDDGKPCSLVPLFRRESAERRVATCHHCGEPIVGRRSSARYCNEECRLAHWARRGDPDFTPAQPAYGRR